MQIFFPMKKLFPLSIFLLPFFLSNTFAQTDLRVSNPKAGFPIAIPRACDSGGGAPYDSKIPEVIRKDLELSGFFSVLPESSYVESAGKCNVPNGVQFSDWSVIGADVLIKANITSVGSTVRAELYLFDVQQQKAVLGKRYEADTRDFSRLAHRFANEVIRYFTGTPGIFGSRIVFVSKVGRFKELFEMDLDGSNLRQLTRERGLAVSPSFHPNGSAVIYTSFRLRKPELFLLPLAGGAPRQITNRDGLEISAKYLKDGSGIIASASFDGNSNIVIFDELGRIVRKVTNGGFIDVSPTLAPDGNRFAFVSNRAGGPQIYVMSLSGGEAKRLSFTGSNYCTSPSWSPNGDKIAFSCMAGGNQLFIANSDGTNALQVTFAGNNEDPAFSPDGRYVLFSSTMAGGRSLMLLPLHSGQPRAISSTGGEDSMPTWGPLE
jgi:TolB protein